MSIYDKLIIHPIISEFHLIYTGQRLLNGVWFSIANEQDQESSSFFLNRQINNINIP